MGAAKAFHAVIDELHTLLGELEADGHKLAAPIKARFEELLTIVKSDAEQVARDAVAAEEPVVNEAVQDVASVGETAVAGDATAPAAETTTG